MEVAESDFSKNLADRSDRGEWFRDVRIRCPRPLVLSSAMAVFSIWTKRLGIDHAQNKPTFGPKLLQVQRSTEFHSIDVIEVPFVVASLDTVIVWCWTLGQRKVFLRCGVSKI